MLHLPLINAVIPVLYRCRPQMCVSAIVLIGAGVAQEQIQRGEVKCRYKGGVMPNFLLSSERVLVLVKGHTY